MTRVPARLPGGGLRRPGADDDHGAVTVEAAYAVLGLVLVALVLAWCLSLVGAQLAVGSAARAAARVAARGEGYSAVAREAHRVAPGSAVTVRVDGTHVVVDVRRTVRPPGGFARLGSVALGARSVALRETP